LIFEMGDTCPASLPLWLQWAISDPLAALARWRKVDRISPPICAPTCRVAPSGALAEPTV